MFNIFKSKNPSKINESIQSGALNDQFMAKEEELITIIRKSEATSLFLTSNSL